MKAYVDALACEQRQLDAQRVIGYFQANSIELVRTARESDVAVFISCAVDTSSKTASLSRIEGLIAEMDGARRLVIGGCLPSISPEIIAKYRPLATFSPRTMETLDMLFAPHISVGMESIEEPHKTVFDRAGVNAWNDSLTAREEYDLAKQGYKIKIDEGCLLNCSYCVIREATGRLKSVAPDVVAQQFTAAVETNEPSIMLLGGDTGAYGYDIGTRFSTLLEGLLPAARDSKVFIHDFNANWLLKDRAQYDRVVRSQPGRSALRAIAVPLQSGSDKVLRLMRRPYNAEDAIRTLAAMKEDVLSLRLGTHIIVGFPGENDEDFRLTMNLLRRVPFDFVTCFSYAAHDRTRSTQHDDRVPSATISERLDAVAELLKEKVKIIR